MSDIFEVSYSPAAQEDIRGIYMYIACELENKQAARKQIDNIRKTVYKLSYMPFRHEIVNWEPWTAIGMRKVSVDNYIVFYLVDDENKKAAVIRVLYGGRDIENIIKEVCS